MEVILKEPVQYQLSYFNSRSFDKYDIFLQVSTGEFTVDKDSATVSYAQGLRFIKEVLNAFHSKGQPNQRNIDQAASLVANTFFSKLCEVFCSGIKYGFRGHKYNNFMERHDI